MGANIRHLPDAPPQSRIVSNVPLQTEHVPIRGFVIAWIFALIFYFLEYAVRSSPSVYTYSITSLVDGAALDHLGAEWPVTVGVVILAVGCLLFGIEAAVAGEAGRLLQGVLPIYSTD